ncbi:MAG: gliding motility-associated ABC transporter substrate-binding protein GldG [Bacteroidales bacterium]
MVKRRNREPNPEKGRREGMKNLRRQALLQLVLLLLLLALVNVVSSFLFFRLDLTAEKRYTLSEPTKELLKNLDDVVYFQVYLEGDFPAGFKRLRKETKEMLDQFRAYSKYIEYEFINPSESSDPKERAAVYQQLMQRGLTPTDLQVKTQEGTNQKIIFPGAIATFRGEERPVELLISRMGVPPEEVLNNSIQNLEYNLANTIRLLTRTSQPKVAYIKGHGELPPLRVADFLRTLAHYYIVEQVELKGKLSSLTERSFAYDSSLVIKNKYDAIIIAKPDSAFSEKDKFIIDQYIMRGGNVLWLIDPVLASMDSIQASNSTVGIVKELNLADQFFNYGFRINTNLVQDLSALPIPVKTGNIGGAPQIDFYPWYFFPVIIPYNEHPIVKNLNAIRTEFISSVDTLSLPGVTKHVLLHTSEYSRTLNTPVIISLDIMRTEPDRRLFNKPHIPVACLLEGTFPSLYANRVPPEIRDSKEIGFIDESRPARMIVVGDGDIVANQLGKGPEGSIQPYPMGYDQYTGETFGNKEFILNAIEYLVEGEGLISIRSRELKLRLLDRERADKERVIWQVINIILPVFIILILGAAMWYKRKRTYTR